MAKMAIIAIMAMANGCINMAMLGIQLKSTKKLANWSWSHLNRLIHSTVITLYVILTFFVSDLHCKIADICKVAATRGYTWENCFIYRFQLVRPQYNEFHWVLTSQTNVMICLTGYCPSCMGWVWRYYCIFLFFVCLDQQQSLYFRLFQSLRCIESKNKTNCERKSAMSSLDP